MKYLQSTPFSSPPANDAFKKNYPFGPTKFERELAAEKAHKGPKGWTCACGTWNECAVTSGAFGEPCWKCAEPNPAKVAHADCK